MSRRDTIIIAVLVNAGLLLVLFATAMRSNKKEDTKELSATPAKEEVLVQAPTPVDSSLETLGQVEIKSDPLAETLNETSDVLAFADEMDIPLTASTIESAPVAPVPAQAASPVVTTSPLQQAPAPAPTVEKKKEEPTVVSVTVKKGDALEKIARAHHSSVNAIMKANNLTSSNLKIGQVLKVPTKESSAVAKKESSSSSPAKTASAPAKAASPGSEYYVVKEGDNPWLIASRNNVKLDELLKLNGMDESKARKLKPGDRLRIR
jgi:peptidoglycan endopeptidase LytF